MPVSSTVRCIGDAEAPGLIAHAVYAGHRYARELEEPVTGRGRVQAAFSFGPGVGFARWVVGLGCPPGFMRIDHSLPSRVDLRCVAGGLPLRPSFLAVVSDVHDCVGDLLRAARPSPSLHCLSQRGAFPYIEHNPPTPAPSKSLQPLSLRFHCRSAFRRDAFLHASNFCIVVPALRQAQDRPDFVRAGTQCLCSSHCSGIASRRIHWALRAKLSLACGERVTFLCVAKEK